MSPISILLYQI